VVYERNVHMSSASPLVPQGPAVDSAEHLYRGITSINWWVSEEQRPSSAAFRHAEFSVDIASLAGSPQHTLSHLTPGSGVVSFNCGQARQLGFDAHQEPDPNHPDNHAHANVYNLSSGNQIKKAAQKLVLLCSVIVEPNFVS